MREIKFRAWVKTTENMYYWKELTHHEEWWRDKNYILMQYTGLKDKNGKEIYEGDILKWTARDNDYSIMEQIDVVSFKNGSFITIDKEYKHAVSFYEDGCKRQITKQSIVIGNIYENKDLLK